MPVHWIIVCIGYIIIQVKQVTTTGVAAHDGHIKRGDRIISVNGFSLMGLTNKQALQKLKEAGGCVTLVMSRKVGRRASRATTPSASALVSVNTSRTVSPQRSPRIMHQRQASSSDEGSREGSRASSPHRMKRHTRRPSVTVHGEILTFKDRKSTLPRKIKGAKLGVQLVELHKGPTGLGIQLQGSADAQLPITVKAVLRGGPAFRSGKIHVGDQIIEVNGLSFERTTQQEAHKTMKELPQGKVSIILRDHKAIMGTEE
jgi:C-terminal processing protease CtpA/Prc